MLLGKPCHVVKRRKNLDVGIKVNHRARAFF